MRTYSRGDRIPKHLVEGDDRFLSKISQKKYWLLQPDGRPVPDHRPYPRKFEIDLVHRAYPELGEYRIICGSVGRPASGVDRKERDRERYQNSEKRRKQVRDSKRKQREQK